MVGLPGAWHRIWESLLSIPGLAELQLLSLWSKMNEAWFGLVLRPEVRDDIERRELELWNKEDIAEGLSHLLKQPEAWVEG